MLGHLDAETLPGIIRMQRAIQTALGLLAQHMETAL